MDANLLNGLSLAYIGDAVFLKKNIENVFNLGYFKVKKIHKIFCFYNSGKNQSEIIIYYFFYGIFSEEEEEIYKRGRNSHNHSVRKNIDIQSYMEATGFEAIIGYLYLSNNFTRINELVDICIKYRTEEM